MPNRKTLIALFSLTLATVSASASSIYVINFNNQFGTVNVSTGAFSPIASLDSSIDGGGQSGLVAGPGGNLLTLDFNGNLDSINPGTGAISVIGATGLGINGFAFGAFGNQIFATDFSNNIYSINPTTGAATLIGATGIPADHEFPFTMNPDGSLELCDESLTQVGGVLYATYDEFAVAPDGFTLNPSPADPANAAHLYRIDPLTGVATLIASTAGQINTTFSIGNTLYGIQGTLSASHNFLDPAISIDSINLTTGALTPVSSIADGGGGIPGAILVPTPEPSSLALLATGVVGFAFLLRRTPLIGISQ